MSIRNGAGVLAFNGFNLQTPNAFDSNDHVLIITDDGGSFSSYLDGTKIAMFDVSPVNQGTVTLTQFSIGSFFRGTAVAFATFRLYGAVRFDRIISGAELTTLTTYAKSLAGIP